jgi:putative nucleotidyltransferase with HDIG domain
MTNDLTEPPVDAATEATLLVEELCAALINVRIYAHDHPRVANSLQAVRRGVGKLTAATGESAVRIAGVEGLIVFAQRPLRGASLSASRLLALMRQQGTSGIELDAAVDDASLREFFVLLLERPQPGASWTTFNEQLAVRGCRSVRLLPPYVEGRSEAPPPTDGVRLSLGLYQAVVDLLQNITVSVCRGGHIDFAPVEAHAEAILDRLGKNGELQSGLARQEQYDAFTLGHSLRVAILALNFARSLTDDRDLLVRIGTAALLHDVGKSLIPFEVLHSSGALSEEERRQMNMHAELGARCLLDHRDADPLAVAAAFGHHRGPHGTGYPRTAHEHPVNLVTSIVKICDIYEALTAARPYKQPMSPVRAYRVMIAMGDKLDRRLLRRFIEVNGVYPSGQFVQLDDGRVAIVRGQTDDPLAPKLALLTVPADVDTASDDEQIFSLGDVACSSARAILGELTPGEARQRLARPS